MLFDYLSLKKKRENKIKKREQIRKNKIKRKNIRKIERDKNEVESRVVHSESGFDPRSDPFSTLLAVMFNSHNVEGQRHISLSLLLPPFRQIVPIGVGCRGR
jgi:hypothetical protein